MNSKQLYSEYNFHEIEDKFNLQFEDKELLVKAFVHPSYNFEPNGNYQRLEFLGDSILQLVVSDYYYRQFPDQKEGDMTKQRAIVVNESSLAFVIKKYALEKYLVLGKSILSDNVELSDSYVADVYESFLAAIYLDFGMEVVTDFVKKTLIPEIDYLLCFEHNQDFKTQLQEIVQKNGAVKIIYSAEKVGNDFVADVLLEGIKIGSGTGKNKKAAEQAAAKSAIENMVEV